MFLFRVWIRIYSVVGLYCIVIASCVAAVQIYATSPSSIETGSEVSSKNREKSGWKPKSFDL